MSGDFLQQMAQSSRQRVEAAKRERSQAALLDRIQTLPRHLACRSANSISLRK
jgi:hypothetical protein